MTCYISCAGLFVIQGTVNQRLVQASEWIMTGND